MTPGINDDTWYSVQCQPRIILMFKIVCLGSFPLRKIEVFFSLVGVGNSKAIFPNEKSMMSLRNRASSNTSDTQVLASSAI